MCQRFAHDDYECINRLLLFGFLYPASRGFLFAAGTQQEQKPLLVKVHFMRFSSNLRFGELTEICVKG